jgi:hypothetical protein
MDWETGVRGAQFQFSHVVPKLLFELVITRCPTCSHILSGRAGPVSLCHDPHELAQWATGGFLEAT